MRMLPAVGSWIPAIGFGRDTDIAVALGTLLVGATENALFPEKLTPWVVERLGSNRPKLISAEANFEQITALRPDLILAMDSYELSANHKLLSEIAPVVHYQKEAGSDTWQDMTLRAGTAIGEQGRAQSLVDQVAQKLRSTRTQHPELEGKTFTFGAFNGGELDMINSTDDSSAALLTEIGLVLSPRIQELPDAETPNRTHLGLERLDAIDADVVLLVFASNAERGAFEAMPVARGMPSVARGAFVPLGYDPALSLAFPTVLSIPYGIDRMVPLLVNAVTA